MAASGRVVAVEAAAALRSLLIAGEQFRRGFAAHLEVSTTEAAVLTYLSADAVVTPRELARWLGVTPSAITAILDRLESRDLIERNKHPSDRRQLVIVPTRYGRSAILRAATHLAVAAATPDVDAVAETCEVIDRITRLLQHHASLLAATDLELWSVDEAFGQ